MVGHTHALQHLIPSWSVTC